MKSSRITSNNPFPSAVNNKAVKALDYNNLKDDFDAHIPSDGSSKFDTINEYTSDTGVLVDGVRLKDGGADLGTTGAFVIKTAVVDVSATELAGMNATPKVLVAAPGAGFALAFRSAVLIYDDNGTDYSGGGVITINYGSGGAAQSSNLAATFLTGNGDKVFNMEKLNAAGGLTMPVNTALVLTNASAAFTGGVGTVKVHIEYSVHRTDL